MTLRRTLSIGLSIVALTLAACGDDDDENGGFVYSDDGRLQVMTRNLYLGADIEPLLTAATQDEFVAAANSVLQFVTVTNDFRVRARAIADEIAATRPDLVGLQEVSLWRTQFPGDRAGGGTIPATTVLLDYLAILRSELSARGLPYVVAAEIELFDLEAPVFIGTTTPTDVRLTDRQVILAIQGLPTSPPRRSMFQTLAPITVLDPSGGTTTLSITRGWTRVDATVGGKLIPFFNTHLESFNNDVRDAQAVELRGIIDAEAVGTAVLVGDLNATPGAGAYNTFVGSGTGDFTDLWAHHGTGDGFTCCFDADLTVTTATLTRRIDDILWRGGLTPLSVTVVGDQLADMVGTPPRWPSDHAGVVGVFDPSSAVTAAAIASR